MRNNGRRAGFTLIEVLVVVVIASIVFAVLLSVLGSSFEILRAGESKAKLNANARAVLDYITDDITSASYIPLSSDRDLNGWPDEADDAAGLGYDLAANWRVAFMDAGAPAVWSSFFLSEAWSDRIMTRHFNSAFDTFFTISGEGRSTPRIISQGGRDRPAQWISFLRLAVPASPQMPYYLSLESDRDGDGSVDLFNTGAAAGVLQGYPDVVAIGPHKETAVAIQDIWYAFGSDEEYTRIRQIPIASNITRVKYEYFHEVPVYLSRAAGADVEIAYQNLEDGSINYVAASPIRQGGMQDSVPMISHWEQRIIDVGYNGSNNGTGFHVDPGTNARYGTSFYKLQDQYPEGYGTGGKADGTHVNPPTGMGLNGWNCTVFYNIDETGDDIADNAPIDRLAFVTTGVSNGVGVEGGVAALRPDMEALHGAQYWAQTTNPTGLGDMGDADGIPDGDGVPDDPVPGWWLPYLRSVRVTVVATPSSVIEQRTARSGQMGKLNSPVFYRLDSPVPYADANRTVPLYNQKQDYIGAGSDLVLTRTVPVNYAYRTELLTDPASPILSGTDARRVDLNYSNGASKLVRDPIAYDTGIVASTPAAKMYQKDPSLLPTTP